MLLWFIRLEPWAMPARRLLMLPMLPMLPPASSAAMLVRFGLNIPLAKGFPILGAPIALPGTSLITSKPWSSSCLVFSRLPPPATNKKMVFHQRCQFPISKYCL